MRRHSQIAKIIGLDILEKLNIPSPDNTDSNSFNVQLQGAQPRPFQLLFNVLIIQLLAVATFGVEQSLSNYCVVDNNQTLRRSARMAMVSATAMKVQIKEFQEKVSSQDSLCSRVIAALTKTDS